MSAFNKQSHHIQAMLGFKMLGILRAIFNAVAQFRQPTASNVCGSLWAIWSPSMDQMVMPGGVWPAFVSTVILSIWQVHMQVIESSWKRSLPVYHAIPTSWWGLGQLTTHKSNHLGNPPSDLQFCSCFWNLGTKWQKMCIVGKVECQHAYPANLLCASRLTQMVVSPNG